MINISLRKNYATVFLKEAAKSRKAIQACYSDISCAGKRGSVCGCMEIDQANLPPEGPCCE